jgi:hypothetical protein
VDEASSASMAVAIRSASMAVNVDCVATAWGIVRLIGGFVIIHSCRRARACANGGWGCETKPPQRMVCGGVLKSLEPFRPGKP